MKEKPHARRRPFRRATVNLSLARTLKKAVLLKTRIPRTPSSSSLISRNESRTTTIDQKLSGHAPCAVARVCEFPPLLLLPTQHRPLWAPPSFSPHGLPLLPQSARIEQATTFSRRRLRSATSGTASHAPPPPWPRRARGARRALNHRRCNFGTWCVRQEHSGTAGGKGKSLRWRTNFRPRRIARPFTRRQCTFLRSHFALPQPLRPSFSLFRYVTSTLEACASSAQSSQSVCRSAERGRKGVSGDDVKGKAAVWQRRVFFWRQWPFFSPPFSYAKGSAPPGWRAVRV